MVICSPLQAARLPLASTTASAAATHAAARKRADYADAPRDKPYIHLVLEISSCFGDDFHAFLADCALRATEFSGIPSDLEDPAFARRYSQCLQHYR